MTTNIDGIKNLLNEMKYSRYSPSSGKIYIKFDKKELELFKVKLKLCINDTDIGIEYWKTLYIVDEGGKTPLYIEHNLKMLQDNASVLRCLLEKFKLDERRD